MSSVNITASNISQYFTVSNSAYYFVGSGSTFTSNNNGIKSSIAQTTLTAKYDFTKVTFNYSYSSEARYDKLTITVGSTTVADALSGVGNSSWTGAVSKGTVITFKYTKDSSNDNNADKCTFSNMVVEGNSVGSRNIYIGVGNKARHVKKLYVGINGIARRIKKAYIGVNGVARLIYKYELATTQWVFTSNGTFTVPETGTYTIELHGGGGGGGAGRESSKSWENDSADGGNGGGSGNKWTGVRLIAGNQYAIIIGSGGSGGRAYTDDHVRFADAGSSGGTTSFGSLYSIQGGYGGDAAYIDDKTYYDGQDGSSVGNLASGTSGGCSLSEYASRGNGGYGGSGYSSGSSGTAGIAIITLTDY